MAKVQFVALFAIILGSVAGFMDPMCSNRDRPPFLAPGDSDNRSYTARFSGFGVAFSACLFSQLFHHSIPGLLRPLRKRLGTLTDVPVRGAAATLALFSVRACLLALMPMLFSFFARVAAKNMRDHCGDFGDLPPVWDLRELVLWRRHPLVDQHQLFGFFCLGRTRAMLPRRRRSASPVLRQIVAGAMVAFTALDTVCCTAAARQGLPAARRPNCSVFLLWSTWAIALMCPQPPRLDHGVVKQQVVERAIHAVVGAVKGTCPGAAVRRRQCSGGQYLTPPPPPPR
jgi:hypothetical protein